MARSAGDAAAVAAACGAGIDARGPISADTLCHRAYSGSVDHCTAFDIAETGKANHVNMLSAIAYARRLTASRQQGKT